MSVTYFVFTYMYVKVYTADVLFTDGYIHFMKCTDIAEQCTYTDIRTLIFALMAGLQAVRVWLLPGVTPIQVQAH